MTTTCAYCGAAPGDAAWALIVQPGDVGAVRRGEVRGKAGCCTSAPRTGGAPTARQIAARQHGPPGFVMLRKSSLPLRSRRPGAVLAARGAGAVVIRRRRTAAIIGVEAPG